MKKSIFSLITILSLLLLGCTTHAQPNDKAAAEKLVREYFTALNAADAAKVVSLFTADGILLPTGAPTASGTEQLTGNYQYVFDNFAFDLKVTIEEVRVQGNYASVRSISKGSLVIKASGQKVEDDFRELFVLQKVDGSWKIATYMYNQAK